MVECRYGSLLLTTVVRFYYAANGQESELRSIVTSQATTLDVLR